MFLRLRMLVFEKVSAMLSLLFGRWGPFRAKGELEHAEELPSSFKSNIRRCDRTITGVEGQKLMALFGDLDQTAPLNNDPQLDFQKGDKVWVRVQKKPTLKSGYWYRAVVEENPTGSAEKFNILARYLDSKYRQRDTITNSEDILVMDAVNSDRVERENKEHGKNKTGKGRAVC